MHITHPIPATVGSTDMKMIWILLTIGLTFAEKLDRTYLPPAGSEFSGGGPGAINIPLELPNVINEPNIQEQTEVSGLIKGIDRTGPNQVHTNIRDETKLGHQMHDIVNFPTKTTSSHYMQSSPFNIIENHSTVNPSADFSLESTTNTNESNEYLINKQTGTLFPSFQNLQTPANPNQHETVNIYPRISMTNKHGEDNLPPYDERNIAGLTSSTTPSSVNNEYDTINDYKHLNSMKYTQNYPENLDMNLSNNNNHTSPKIAPVGLINTSNRKFSFNNYESTERQPEKFRADTDRYATILNYDQVRTPEEYAYSYDTSNGIHADESGTAVNGVKAKGSYSYIGDDGIVYQVIYTADENGFVPKGAHLPTSPPIPNAIAKVIEQVAKEKESGIYDDGSYNEEKYGYKKYQGRNNKLQILPQENKLNLRPEEDNTFGMAQKESDLIIKPSSYNFPLRSTLNENNILPNIGSGYQYPAPQNTVYNITEMESFPLRFSEVSHPEQISAKATVRPFLTPYVSRKDDDSENFNEKLLENNFSEISRDSLDHSPFLQVNIPIKENFVNVIEHVGDSHELLSDIARPGSGGERQYENGNQNANDQSHFYHNLDQERTNMPSIGPYIVSTSPKTVLRDLPPSSISTTQFNRYTPGSASSNFKNPQFSSILNDELLTNVPLEIMNPTTLDNDLVSDYPRVIKPVVISTPKSIDPAGRKLVESVTPFRPSTGASLNSGINSGQTTPGYIVGEDFSGPKQQQRLDPATGYYY